MLKITEIKWITKFLSHFHIFLILRSNSPFSARIKYFHLRSFTLEGSYIMKYESLLYSLIKCFSYFLHYSYDKRISHEKSAF